MVRAVMNSEMEATHIMLIDVGTTRSTMVVNFRTKFFPRTFRPLIRAPVACWPLCDWGSHRRYRDSHPYLQLATNLIFGSGGALNRVGELV